MNNLKSILSTIVLLLTFTTVSAQYGNGYGGNSYGNNGYGRQRLDSDIRNSEPEKPKEIPVEVTVAEIMKKLTPELKLDVLQEIAIGNVMKESIREQGIIIKDEKVDQGQKLKEITALSEITTRKINEFLNPDQRDLYKKMMEDSMKSRGSKKSKKSKRDK